MASDNIEKLGYHATTRYAAEQIMRNRLFRMSSNNDDWLGKGIYFWENEEHCSTWRRSSNRIAVQINCPKNRYVDLQVENEMDDFCDFAQQLCKEIEEAGEIIPEFVDIHQRQRFFCDYYKESKKLLLMRGIFPRRANVVGFNVYRPQLCASSNSIIKIIDSKVI